MKLHYDLKQIPHESPFVQTKPNVPSWENFLVNLKNMYKTLHSRNQIKFLQQKTNYFPTSLNI